MKVIHFEEVYEKTTTTTKKPQHFSQYSRSELNISASESIR